MKVKHHIKWQQIKTKNKSKTKYEENRSVNSVSNMLNHSQETTLNNGSTCNICSSSEVEWSSISVYLVTFFFCIVCKQVSENYSRMYVCMNGQWMLCVQYEMADMVCILELDRSVPVPRHIEGTVGPKPWQQRVVVVKNLLGVTLPLKVTEQ